MSTFLRTALTCLALVAMTPRPVLPQVDLTDVHVIEQRLKLFAPAELSADLSTLPKGDREALPDIIRAAEVVDSLYLRQAWEGNTALLDQLRRDTSADGKIRLRYFKLNLGPWSVADRLLTFIAGAPQLKPSRGTLYPSDMPRREWGPWFIKQNDMVQRQAIGPLYVIRRDSSGTLMTVPYAVEYASLLSPASRDLRSAAGLVADTSTRNTLLAIARAFGDDDYAAAEKAMLHSEGPLNVMIGPTDRSADGLFWYKRGFEAVVGVRNERETGRLKLLEIHLPAIEKFLTGRTTTGGGETPGATIRVDDAVYMGGGSRVGSVGTAVRLPSDTGAVEGNERRTNLLRNVHEAKFRLIQKPIADLMLNPQQAKEITFDVFFLHLMMHELSHRFQDVVSDSMAMASLSLETPDERIAGLREAGADAAGLVGLQFLIGKGTLDKKIETSLYTGEVSSLLRALRFGLTDNYAKGAAIQFNYYLEQGAVLPDTDSRRYRVDVAKMKKAAKDLFTEIAPLLEDPSPARRDTFMSRYADVPPGLSTLRERLAGIPYDLEPSFPLAH